MHCTAHISQYAAVRVRSGMELEGKGQIEGLWEDHTVGLDGARSDIAIMRTLDGHSKLELTGYHAPATPNADPLNPLMCR